MQFDHDFDGRYPHIQFKRHWEVRSDVNYVLGRCHAMVDAICDTPLQPETRDRLLRVSLVKGAQATTAIEGNTLSEQEVERVFEGQTLAISKQYQQREVHNILEAMNGILDAVVADGHSTLITPELIRGFHRQVGEELGAGFEAVPGRFRTDDRIVGPYRCPRPQDIDELVNRLCEWLQVEFGFAANKQTFADAVVQAIVTHVYLEWIHPFGDGNGRTGRLLEFYILMRAGAPDIASHILSNFYNETRPEYYRQLDQANKTRDLSAFLAYAIQGYHDGLQRVLHTISNNVCEVAWRYLVHSRFAERPYHKKVVFKRRRRLVLAMPPDKSLTPDELMMLTPELAREYAQLSVRTLLRDVKELQEMDLVRADGSKFRLNLGLLSSHIAARRRPKKRTAA